MTHGSLICQSYVLVKASLVTCKTMVLVRLGVIIHATPAIVFFLKKLALTLGPCFFKHLLLDQFPIELKLAVVVRYETIFKMLYPI